MTNTLGELFKLRVGYPRKSQSGDGLDEVRLISPRDLTHSSPPLLRPLFIDGSYSKLAKRYGTSAQDIWPRSGRREEAERFHPMTSNEGSSEGSDSGADSGAGEEQSQRRARLLAAAPGHRYHSLDTLQLPQKEIERHRLRDRDILLLSKAQLPGVYLFTHPEGPFRANAFTHYRSEYLATSAFIVISELDELKPKRLSPEALCAWLSNAEGRAALSELNNSQTGQWRVSSAQLRALEIPLWLFKADQTLRERFSKHLAELSRREIESELEALQLEAQVEQLREDPTAQVNKQSAWSSFEVGGHIQRWVERMLRHSTLSEAQLLKLDASSFFIEREGVPDAVDWSGFGWPGFDKPGFDRSGFEEGARRLRGELGRFFPRLEVRLSASGVLCPTIPDRLIEDLTNALQLYSIEELCLKRKYEDKETWLWWAFDQLRLALRREQSQLPPKLQKGFDKGQRLLRSELEKQFRVLERSLEEQSILCPEVPDELLTDLADVLLLHGIESQSSGYRYEKKSTLRSSLKHLNRVKEWLLGFEEGSGSFKVELEQIFSRLEVALSEKGVHCPVLPDELIEDLTDALQLYSIEYLCLRRRYEDKESRLGSTFKQLNRELIREQSQLDPKLQRGFDEGRRLLRAELKKAFRVLERNLAAQSVLYPELPGELLTDLAGVLSLYGVESQSLGLSYAEGSKISLSLKQLKRVKTWLGFEEGSRHIKEGLERLFPELKKALSPKGVECPEIPNELIEDLTRAFELYSIEHICFKRSYKDKETALGRTFEQLNRTLRREQSQLPPEYKLGFDEGHRLLRVELKRQIRGLERQLEGQSTLYPKFPDELLDDLASMLTLHGVERQWLGKGYVKTSTIWKAFTSLKRELQELKYPGEIPLEFVPMAEEPDAPREELLSGRMREEPAPREELADKRSELEELTAQLRALCARLDEG